MLQMREAKGVCVCVCVCLCVTVFVSVCFECKSALTTLTPPQSVSLSSLLVYMKLIKIWAEIQSNHLNDSPSRFHTLCSFV